MGSQDGGQAVNMDIDPWREQILSQVSGWATEPPPDEPESVLSIGEPIDWHALWADDEADEDWLIEPLIAAGRLVSIYSVPKIGKSLLMLARAQVGL